MRKTVKNWNVDDILRMMKEQGSEENRKGMARYGIIVDNAYGVKIDWTRDLAKSIGKDHQLAQELWRSQVHEARILATIIADPKLLDRALMEDWVKDFYSWDLCDQCCSNLFGYYGGVRQLIPEWCARPEEFVRRAGYVLIAVLSVKDKKSPSSSFAPYLKLIEDGSSDERNNVRKAVNWALRQIGKRDLAGHAMALPVAERLSDSNDRTARWIGKDARRELRSDAVLRRLEERAAKADVKASAGKNKSF